MRNSIVTFIILFLAYSLRGNTTIYKDKDPGAGREMQIIGQQEICWSGTINNKIPVFLHYLPQGKVIIGEIVYLNTKDRKPIKVVGKIEEDKSYRLLEFESSGNISGIITGNPTQNSFTGSWFSPKTRKELRLQLGLKDTLIATANYKVNNDDLFGSYHYQYSTEGYYGDFEIKRLRDNKAAFSIVSVTGAPSRNIADVAVDTIQLNGNNFIYKIPDTDSCEFRATFYKDFVDIEYTKGYCPYVFGLNATIDGIYLKVGR